MFILQYLNDINRIKCAYYLVAMDTRFAYITPKSLKPERNNSNYRFSNKFKNRRMTIAALKKDKKVLKVPKKLVAEYFTLNQHTEVFIEI